jgi:hypothetical protein
VLGCASGEYIVHSEVLSALIYYYIFRLWWTPASVALAFVSKDGSPGSEVTEALDIATSAVCPASCLDMDVEPDQRKHRFV